MMKRIPLALGAMVLVAGPVWAQQVTIGGVADAGVRVVSNQGRGSVSSLSSGGNSTSKLIIRGNEDLGDGMLAGFYLEHGFLLDTGTPVSSTMFWDRRATVSIGSKSWGEIRAGRDYVPSYSNWTRYDPFTYVGAAGANNLISTTNAGPLRAAFGSGANTTVRSSNSLQYILPGNLGGWEGGLLVAAGEGGTAANGQHKVVAGRFGYATSAFNLAIALTRTENNLTGSSGLNDLAVGGSYDMGFARVSAAWRQFKLGDSEQVNYLVGAWIPMGQGTVKLSWNRADLRGRIGTTKIDANDGQQFGLGYVHDLSKRSAVYGTVSRITNDGGATYVVPGGAAGLAGGGNSTAMEVGVRHSF